MYIHFDKPWEDFSRFGIPIQSKKNVKNSCSKVERDSGLCFSNPDRTKTGIYRVEHGMENFRYGLISFLTNADLETSTNVNYIIIQFS